MEPPKINTTELIKIQSILAEDAPTGYALLENFIKTTALEYAKESVLHLKQEIFNKIDTL